MTYTARDVKDRVIQYPGRYKLTLVEGTTDTYDLEAVPGTITETGTAVNRAYLLPIENALQSNDGNIATLLERSGVNGRQFFTAGGTFTAVKTGLHKIICQGKGGNGGDGNDRCSGGGAGGTCIGYADLVAGTDYTVTISSSQSIFNGTFIANAGSNGSATSTSSTPSGGTGGSASGGTINITGQSGKDYFSNSSAGIYWHGVGGSSMFGFGSLNLEEAPSGYGAGGSGDSSTTGTAGFVLIEW